MALQVIFLMAGLVHLGLAAGASWAVWRDDTLGATQRCMQSLLACLLPFAGPLFVLHLADEHCPAAIPRFLKSWPLAFLFKHGKGRQRSTGNGEYAKHDGDVRPRSDTAGEAGCGADSAGGD